MDVLPAGGSKAEGVSRLADRTGFSPEHVYAFGDNFNDLEMFRYAGCSIAMGNAPHSLQQLASHVTASAEQDGIWHGLKWAGLL
ncbi:putative bifunctional phosphatase/peptidyl-prolyl cis-trans isomerase [compost metagenome]